MMEGKWGGMEGLLWGVLALLGFVLVAALAIIGWAISLYNSMVRQKNLVLEGWSLVDVQLKRRSNLVPNLVETVKGYAGHESEVLEKVTAQRSLHGPNEPVAERAAQETAIGQALVNLFAVAEAYPDLKANESFQNLHKELSGLEDVIQKARRYYNGTVRDFNTMIQQFPNNLLAGMFAFHAAEFFELDDPADADVPKVDFSTGSAEK